MLGKNEGDIAGKSGPGFRRIGMFFLTGGGPDF